MTHALQRIKEFNYLTGTYLFKVDDVSAVLTALQQVDDIKSQALQVYCILLIAIKLYRLLHYLYRLMIVSMPSHAT